MSRPPSSGKDTPFLKQLTARAKSYLQSLHRAGLRGEIVPGSARTYSLKVEVWQGSQSLGKVVVYYSPKINVYAPVFQEISAGEWVSRLKQAWHHAPPASVGSPGNEAVKKGWEAYVDGSYHRGKTGYGAVVLEDDQPVEEFSGRVPPEFSHSRQVGGELFAVYEVIRCCLAKGVEELVIFYDYYGIEKWATGRWKANLPLTQNYARFIEELPVRVRWVKVKGHSGNRWNERADHLARQGCSP